MFLRTPFSRHRESGWQTVGSRFASMIQLLRLRPNVHLNRLLLHRFHTEPGIAAPLRRAA